MFQGLPAHGQRTKANGKTPSHNHPYQKLGIDLSIFSNLSVLYKKRELKNNGRREELKALIVLKRKRSPK